MVGEQVTRTHTLVVGAMGVTVYPQVDGRLQPLSDDHVSWFEYKNLDAEYYSIYFDQEADRWEIKLYNHEREEIER
jgi:hypothetical protein